MIERDAQKAKHDAGGTQFQVQGHRLLMNLAKSFRGTWKIYRHSKTGLVGLAIVFGFFGMAIFAPFISPYSTDFRAPAQDIFIADSIALELPQGHNWTPPIGLTAPPVESTLERIMVYSLEGTTMVFPVHPGISQITGESGIVVEEGQEYNLPENLSYVNYAHFPHTSGMSFFLLLNTTPESPGSSTMVSVLYEYTYNLIDANVEYMIPFVPKYHSNLWNGYARDTRDARMALVFADEHNLWLLDKRPKYDLDPRIVSFTSAARIDNATIIGAPLVMDASFRDNGSVIVVPTDKGIWTYALNITEDNVTTVVYDVRIGDILWASNYTTYNKDTGTWDPFEPVASENMITFQYPYNPTNEVGKETIMLPAKDGRVVAYDRKTGNVAWANRLIMPSIRDYEISSVFPSPRALVVTGKSGDRGFVAGMDPATGFVKYNQTMYTSVSSHLTSEPEYVDGLRMFLFSTADDNIYLASELLKINATFGVPGGGAATPVAEMGNIYTASVSRGNYFGVVTRDNRLYVSTLSGVNIAPLPPGRYPSGNRYILGTDYEGHDILSWLIFGTRAELMVGLTAAFFSVVIGTIVGLVAGFYGGLIDDVLMRATDVVLSLPGLVVILLFAAVFGPSLPNIIIIIAILSWAGIARVIRSVTLSLKERSFVDAAIIAGASESRLIFKHIAPNVLPYTFLYMTFGISGAIVTEAILAFLGFGDVNYVTWGMMLQYLQISGHSLDAPWWLLPPGLAITLLSLAFYLIGRAFDEVVNPRLRKR
jgi:peptide/nickel transport system permease protein